MITYARYKSYSPCQSSVDYRNMERPSMHFIIKIKVEYRDSVAAGLPWGK